MAYRRPFLTNRCLLRSTLYRQCRPRHPLFRATSGLLNRRWISFPLLMRRRSILMIMRPGPRRPIRRQYRYLIWVPNQQRVPWFLMQYPPQTKPPFLWLDDLILTCAYQNQPRLEAQNTLYRRQRRLKCPGGRQRIRQVNWRLMCHLAQPVSQSKKVPYLCHSGFIALSQNRLRLNLPLTLSGLVHRARTAKPLIRTLR
nr:hypothetical protein 398p2_00001 [Serratia entomophila]